MAYSVSATRFHSFSLEMERKCNIYKTYRRRLKRLLKVFFVFNFHPVNRGEWGRGIPKYKIIIENCMEYTVKKGSFLYFRSLFRSFSNICDVECSEILHHRCLPDKQMLNKLLTSNSRRFVNIHLCIIYFAFQIYFNMIDRLLVSGFNILQRMKYMFQIMHSMEHVFLVLNISKN